MRMDPSVCFAVLPQVPVAIYIFREELAALGTFKQKGRDDTEILVSETEDILSRCTQLVPSVKVVNPHLPSGPVHAFQLDESVSSFRGVWCTFSFLFYFELIFLLANSEDADQTLRSAVSDLGVHCLPMSQKWYARLRWVNSTLSLNMTTQ